jgi:tripartite-type tricarboxylate transporter receptor subunit TctC
MSRRLGSCLAEDLRPCVGLLIAALAVAGHFAPSARADSVATFYQGKDIKLLVSGTVGGGYDIYARTLAKHLGAHIPGHPAVIPQNMPAAGGLAAANYTYNVAPRDGTVICLLQNTVALEPLYANKQAQFDAAKLSWQAMSSPFWSSIKTSRPNWYPQAKIRFLFQYGAEPHPELKDVPFALDLLRNEADKALLVAASAPLGLGRPFVAPPGVPADRMAALRAAMTATFNDAEFRADCEKQRLECNNPKTGAEIETLITQAYATPEDIRKRLIDIYQLGLGAENK